MEQDLSDLAHDNTGRTALVLGASIAGLSTARALADHFEQVLVLERDQLPEGSEYRPGAPQARQFHTLLLSGLHQMEAWFPGIRQELSAAGAVSFDLTGDTRVRLRNRWLPQFTSGQQLLSCSRLLLEATIRSRLRRMPQVRFVQGVEVSKLLSDEGRTRVTGVRVQPRQRTTGSEGMLEYHADLVVDALGRRSPTPDWLQELGYQPPQEIVVDSFLGYVTRRYRRSASTPLLLLSATAPSEPFAGLILPEEDGTMVVMMAGYNQHYPPTDEEGFLAFAEKLSPEFHQLVRAAEPLSQAYGYRGTSSRWRHYELLKRWPERYVVLGDAFCGFNPIYGQGMSMASMSAALLAEQVKLGRGNLDGVARRTLQAIGQVTQGAWLLATSADLEWPGTQGASGKDGPAERFGRWYVGQLLDAVAFDNTVRTQFNAVNQLTQPLPSLFSPDILLRVLWQIVLKTWRSA